MFLLLAGLLVVFVVLVYMFKVPIPWAMMATGMLLVFGVIAGLILYILEAMLPVMVLYLVITGLLSGVTLGTQKDWKSWPSHREIWQAFVARLSWPAETYRLMQRT